MKCDLCGTTVDTLASICTDCGHGICQECLDEMREKFITFPSCFWWSCTNYNKVYPIPQPAFEGITLNAQRFGSVAGWTTELAEDSIISIPQMMFSELAEAVAEQEELSMIEGDNRLTRSELDQMLNQIEDQGYQATEMLLRPRVAARLRNAMEMDADEIRVTERIQFAPDRQNPLAYIGDID